jgi:predicted secreted protein
MAACRLIQVAVAGHIGECTAVTAPCPLMTYLGWAQMSIWTDQVDCNMALSLVGQLAAQLSSLGAWHTGVYSAIPDLWIS